MTIRDYHAWIDDDGDFTYEVRWYGGPQVNLYVSSPGYRHLAPVEVNVASEGNWWSVRPNLEQVAAFAEELLAETGDEDSIWYG